MHYKAQLEALLEHPPETIPALQVSLEFVDMVGWEIIHRNMQMFDEVFMLPQEERAVILSAALLEIQRERKQVQLLRTLLRARLELQTAAAQLRAIHPALALAVIAVDEL